MGSRRRGRFDGTIRFTAPWPWWKGPFGVMGAFLVVNGLAFPFVDADGPTVGVERTFRPDLILVLLPDDPGVAVFCVLLGLFLIRVASISVTIRPDAIRVVGILRTRTVPLEQVRGVGELSVLGDPVPAVEWRDGRGRSRRTPLTLFKGYDPDYADTQAGFRLPWAGRMQREWTAHRSAGLKKVRAWVRTAPRG